MSTPPHAVLSDDTGGIRESRRSLPQPHSRAFRLVGVDRLCTVQVHWLGYYGLDLGIRVRRVSAVDNSDDHG